MLASRDATHPPLLDALAQQPIRGYRPNGPPSVEPTAIAAMALLANHRIEPAVRALRWITRCQQPDGSVAARPELPAAYWSGGPAMCVWAFAARHVDASFAEPALRARQWSVALYGVALERSAEHKIELGHDVRLRAWPWVAGTHSWVEPTCWQMMGLHAVAQVQGSEKADQRTSEALQLLLDRQLPAGGWNYGNTSVLGQTLLPHLQPTAFALLALRCLLGDSELEYARQSRHWLQEAVQRPCGGASWAWSRLALQAWGATNAPEDNSSADLESLRPPTPYLPSPLRDALVTLAQTPGGHRLLTAAPATT